MRFYILIGFLFGCFLLWIGLSVFQWREVGPNLSFVMEQLLRDLDGGEKEKQREINSCFETLGHLTCKEGMSAEQKEETKQEIQRIRSRLRKLLPPRPENLSILNDDGTTTILGRETSD